MPERGAPLPLSCRVQEVSASLSPGSGGEKVDEVQGSPLPTPLPLADKADLCVAR